MCCCSASRATGVAHFSPNLREVGLRTWPKHLGRAVLFQRGHINYEAVLYIALSETFVRLVDVLDLDQLDV
jgi:hypothetical protein